MKKFTFLIQWEEVYSTAFYVTAETKEEAKKKLEDMFLTTLKDCGVDEKDEKPEIKANTKYGDSIKSWKVGDYLGHRVKKNAVCFIEELKK